MRVHLTGTCFALAVILLGSSAFSMYDGKRDVSDTVSAAAGIIVKFEPQAQVSIQKNAAGDVLTGLPEMDRLNARWGVTGVDRIVRGSENHPGHPFERYFVIRAEGNPDYRQMVSEYGQLASVERAELDYVFELDDAPNDPLFGNQFNLYNTGQLHPVVVQFSGDYNDYVAWVSGTAGADINAYDVLSSPPDNTSTAVVALIDSGVDLDHPDLAGRIWTNVREIPDNGLDDDRNGYTDDVVGWYFNGNDSNNDPTDGFGHGSHCAGIMAGVINNSVGIAGVCPDVKVMALKVELYTSNLIAAIVYAVDNGADVISMSWGGSGYPYTMGDAMVYAKSKGLILVTSSGNFGTDTIRLYPAWALETISVGASTDDDEVADFSSYGERLDLVAPGVDILSLRADDLDPYGTLGGSFGIEPGVHVIEDYYYLMTGTSMSCPTVSGVAACLKSVSPGLSPDKAKEILTQTADDYLDPYDTGAYLPGWDKYSGWGRVNLGGAVAATPSVIAQILSPAPNENLAGPSVNITGSAGGSGFESYVLEYGEGWNPTEWTQITASTSPVTNDLLGVWSVESLLGFYTVRLRVGDDNYDMVTVFIGPELRAEIASPVDGDSLSGFTRINGTVYGPMLTRWVLDYRQVSHGKDWTELVSTAKPMLEDLLHVWETAELDSGSYLLRLSAYSDAGLETQQEITVQKIADPQPQWTNDIGIPMVLGPNYGDIDGDGQKEIVIGTAVNIAVLNPDGTMKTTGVPAPAYGDYRSQVSIGNLDGDGIDDIVALRFDVPGVYGFPSSGDDFVIPYNQALRYTVFGESEYKWPSVGLADTDGDGIDEMYLHCGDMRFCFIIPLKMGETAVSQVWSLTDFVAADLDNDGLNERYGLKFYTGSVDKLDENGASIDTYVMPGEPGTVFLGTGISAFDIDGDDALELIVSGYFLPQGDYAINRAVSDLMIYAFESGLEPMDGWPHHTDIYGVNAYHPVFGDIDNDGRIEYFVSVDLGYQGRLYVWHVDGTPYQFDTGDCLVLDSARFTPATLADLNGDGLSEIIAGYHCGVGYENIFGNGVAAWDCRGHLLPGFPLMYFDEPGTLGRILPMISDLDNDGKVELTTLTDNTSLAHFEFDADFDTAASPAVSWRYNPSRNPVGPSFWSGTGGPQYKCGDANGDDEVDPLDVVYLVNWFWRGGPPPVSLTAVDVDGDSGVNPMDAVYFVNWMWRGGPGLQCP